MNENERDFSGFNRRDFLKSGSVASLMTMLGGVQMLASPEPAEESKVSGPPVKVAVIGLGAWGREIVNTLARIKEAEIAGICDTYAPSVKRCAKDAPTAAQTHDYTTLLDNKDIRAVVVATPTHQHKEIVLAALKAGKHVYCEAPISNSIEEAKEIALAAKAAKTCVFQAGLQMRSDKERLFLLPFLRARQLGTMAMIRGQWHKKQSWRASSPNPEHEQALNWRLDKSISLGLLGEMGCHPVDVTGWFLGQLPVAVTAFGKVLFYQDGRTEPDTVQAVFEFPHGVNMSYDATLANSFDGTYEAFYGSDAAIMLREDRAWMFKEVDSPNFDWEVYTKKENFGDEVGYVLKADASKSVQTKQEVVPFTNTPLSFALTNFMLNSRDVDAAAKNFTDAYGTDDADALAQAMLGVPRRAAAGYLEGFQATVTAVVANQAMKSGQRVEIKPELYTLG